LLFREWVFLKAPWFCFGLFAVFVWYGYKAQYGRWLAAFFVGIGVFLFHWQQLLHWQLAQHDIKKNIQVSGWVASIPRSSPLRIQFKLEAKCIHHRAVHTHLLLSWYRHRELQAGQFVTMMVKLKPLHPFHNPGDLNRLPYYWSQGVVARGYVTRLLDASRGVKKHRPFSLTLLSIRESIAQFIFNAVPNKALAAIIAALCLGVRNAMSVSQWQVFQNTGTSHLIAISGLHIGLVAAFIFKVSSWGWRRFPVLLERLPAPKLAAMVALLGAFIYSAMAGFAIPTQRALIMLSVLFLNVLFDLSLPLYWRMALAWSIVVAWDPFALAQASFWLSFFAVISIALVMLRQGVMQGRLRQWWLLQLGLFFGLLPITLWFFQKISLVMFPSNAVAIPWVSLMVVPLALLGCVALLLSASMAKGLFTLAAWCLWPLWKGLQWLSHLPHVTWMHNVDSVFVVLPLMMSVLLFFLPKGWPGRWLFWIGVLPLFFYAYPRPKQGQAIFTVLDVGQGLACVLQTAHHTLVYDTGAKSVLGFDAGAQVVLPYLRYLGVTHLDLMMISHGDNDHIGGAASVLQMFPDTPVLTSVPWKIQSAQACFAGQHWTWDGVRFHVLWPLPGRRYLDNDSSCVLQVKTQHQSLLLTGDIEKPVESELVRRYGGALKSAALVAPHHGSRSSSSWEFVRAVHPQWVVYSVGFYNRYHFPDVGVVGRYAQIGADGWRTDRSGAWVWSMG